MSSPVSGPRPDSQPSSYVFAVYAEADPDVMPRVLEQFARRSLVPARWYSAIVDGLPRELQIDVRVDGLEAGLAAHIARSLETLVNVRQVVTARA
jgi:hypothetical protein